MTALDEMTPSVELLRALVDFHTAGAELDDLTAAIVGWERIVSWATACQNELLGIADRLVTSPDFDMPYGDAVQWFPDHLGLALNLSGGSTAHRIGQATHLVHDLPNLHAALKAGDRRRAKARCRRRQMLSRAHGRERCSRPRPTSRRTSPWSIEDLGRPLT